MPPLKDCKHECCNGHVHGEHLVDADNQNDKYGKRRVQTYRKRRQRMRGAFILVMITLVALSITYVAVHRRRHRLRREDRGHQRRELENIYGKKQQLQNGHHGSPRNSLQQQRQKQNGDDGDGDAKSLFGSLNIFGKKSNAMVEAEKALEELNQNIRENHNNGIRWVNMGLVPSIGSHGILSDKPMLASHNKDQGTRKSRGNVQFFKIRRKMDEKMKWEIENETTMKHKTDEVNVNLDNTPTRSTFVDYSRDDGQHVHYEYPPKLSEPPARLGDYPKLMPLREIMEVWPQDELDDPPSTIEEVLIHFDYTIPEDREAAVKFRDAKLPFKMINVPEVVAAGEKWTDDYLSRNFDGGIGLKGPQASGTCQESRYDTQTKAY